MDYAHDSTSRLSATDELMMGSPHASPAKGPNVSIQLFRSARVRLLAIEPCCMFTPTDSSSVGSKCRISTDSLEPYDVLWPFWIINTSWSTG